MEPNSQWARDILFISLAVIIVVVAFILLDVLLGIQEGNGNLLIEIIEGYPLNNQNIFDNPDNKIEFEPEIQIDFERMENIYAIKNEVKWRNSELSEGKAYRIATLIYDKSIENDVDPFLITAIASVESDFRPNVRSSAGAIGILQLMPIISNKYEVNPYDVEENIKGGVQFIRDLIERYNCHILALGHYNGGNNPEYKIQYFYETRNYVQEVDMIYQALTEN